MVLDLKIQSCLNYQCHILLPKKNGSGLGLSIVVKIINDHNGTIDFLNYNKGAKIKITFPKIDVS